MPTWRWFGGVLVTSAPLILIVPAVGVSKPATMRSVVVLPQPLGPRNEMNSPRSTSRLKFSTAVDWAKLLRTLLRSRKAITTSLFHANNLRAAGQAAAEHLEQPDRQPCQREAEDGQGRGLIHLAAAQLVHIRPKRRLREQGCDRKFAH